MSDVRERAIQALMHVEPPDDWKPTDGRITKDVVREQIEWEIQALADAGLVIVSRTDVDRLIQLYDYVNEISGHIYEAGYGKQAESLIAAIDPPVGEDTNA